MAYITKRGSSYGVRYTYQDEQGKNCNKWESFSTKEEAVNRLHLTRKMRTVQKPCRDRANGVQKENPTRNLTILRWILVRSRELESLAL